MPLGSIVNQEVISGHTVEYRYVIITHGAQYVIITGTREMPVLYVDSLDTHHMVRLQASTPLTANYHSF